MKLRNNQLKKIKFNKKEVAKSLMNILLMWQKNLIQIQMLPNPTGQYGKAQIQ